MSLLVTRDLTRRYGRRVGIEEVNLDVPEGMVFGFLGPNGAGKTTTIRVLLGLLRPSRGTASIMGRDCWRESPRVKREIGYVAGDLRLYPWMTASSGLRMVGRIRGVDLRRSGTDLSERFRLEMNLPVRKMSRGMRQKLGLVLALAHRPRLLILDEPTSGLDPLMQDELARCLRELAGQGHTVFFSSHTLSEVEQLCERVAIVRDGRIVADETLEALRRRARRSVTIVWPTAELASRIEPPDMLTVNQRGPRQWQCELAGAAPPLLQWASRQPIEDMSIGPPNLESLFRQYYGIVRK